MNQPGVWNFIKSLWNSVPCLPVIFIIDCYNYMHGQSLVVISCALTGVV